MVLYHLCGKSNRIQIIGIKYFITLGRTTNRFLPMINFFRKIRKKMADYNKPLKYMRYAIGEIVLVVIGILIALSVNNWNENKIHEKPDFI